MRRPALATFLSLGLASAAPSIMARQDDNKDPPAPHRLVIGGPGRIFTADFDGSKFSITSAHVATGASPSWLLPRIKSNANLLYAVNENSNDLDIFNLGSDFNKISAETESAWGSEGAVFLEFNKDESRLVSAAYGEGVIDVWDSTADDGSLKSPKRINPSDLGPTAAGAHSPHQAAVDPSGRYFAVPDLDGNKLFLLDSHEDRWDLTVAASYPPNTKPRHGSFLKSAGVTYYAMVTEGSNELFLYQVDYDGDGVAKFTEIQKQGTYGSGPGPADVVKTAAGELAVARNQRDVYISNRQSGNTTDFIVHFSLQLPTNDGKGNSTKASLVYGETLSSHGRLPRMLSISTGEDQPFVFVAHQDGDAGVVAFKRDEGSGKLDPTPVATLPSNLLIPTELAAAPNVGPLFVREI